MRIRNGFVSNSSSTSFIIKNNSKTDKNIVDFVKENPQLVEMYNDQYSYEHTQEDLIKSAEDLLNEHNDDNEFKPGESKQCVFGDEDGTVIGAIFDYILRDGGESENFTWRFDQYYR